VSRTQEIRALAGQLTALTEHEPRVISLFHLVSFTGPVILTGTELARPFCA
jgi:hypothetical protein